MVDDNGMKGQQLRFITPGWWLQFDGAVWWQCRVKCFYCSMYVNVHIVSFDLSCKDAEWCQQATVFSPHL